MSPAILAALMAGLSAITWLSEWRRSDEDLALALAMLAAGAMLVMAR